MIKYKCGHQSKGLIIVDSDPLNMSCYFRWKDSVGIDGDKSQCWKCFCNTQMKPKRC